MRDFCYILIPQVSNRVPVEGEYEEGGRGPLYLLPQDCGAIPKEGRRWRGTARSQTRFSFSFSWMIFILFLSYQLVLKIQNFLFSVVWGHDSANSPLLVLRTKNEKRRRVQETYAIWVWRSAGVGLSLCVLWPPVPIQKKVPIPNKINSHVSM